jgi:hypothetical protein
MLKIKKYSNRKPEASTGVDIFKPCKVKSKLNFIFKKEVFIAKHEVRLRVNFISFDYVYTFR